MPVALLVAAAIPRMQSGLAIDAAYPVPNYAVQGFALPANAYRQADDVLAKANPGDGRTLIERAEIASLAGAPREQVVDLLENGLSLTPASVRGWTLLAEQVEMQDRMRSTQALAHSLLLGPYEYFVVFKRARAVADLWDALPSETSEAALSQARHLWTESTLNRQIPEFLQVKGAPELMTRAFHDDPDDLRALNRWLASERRRLAQ